MTDKENSYGCFALILIGIIWLYVSNTTGASSEASFDVNRLEVQVSELENEIQDRDDRISELEGIIDELNRDIMFAKYYEGESWQDMADALSSLDEASY